MRGQIGFAFFFLMVIPILLFVPDVIIYGTQNWKANAIVEQVTREAENEGGVNANVEKQFSALLKQYGMEDKGLTITYSEKGNKNYQERFTITIKGSYTFRAFNLLGTGLGEFTKPIEAMDSGRSEVWYRS